MFDPLHRSITGFAQPGQASTRLSDGRAAFQGQQRSGCQAACGQSWFAPASRRRLRGGERPTRSRQGMLQWEEHMTKTRFSLPQSSDTLCMFAQPPPLSPYTQTYDERHWFTGIRSAVTVPASPLAVYNSLSRDLHHVFQPMTVRATFLCFSGERASSPGLSVGPHPISRHRGSPAKLSVLEGKDHLLCRASCMHEACNGTALLVTCLLQLHLS